MKRRIVAVLVAAVLLVAIVGCGREEAAAPPQPQAAVRAYATLLPQEHFVEQIGGEHISVRALIGPGENPHTYEPSPRQISALAQADVYFLIGVPFEQAIRGQIEAANPDMRMVNTTEGVELRPMGEHEHAHELEHHDEHAEEEHNGHDHEHGEGARDPHVWLDPANVKVMARNIADALVELDPEHAADYRRNLDVFLGRLDALDTEIREITRDLENRRFLVYHPAFGYFAEAYGLEQIPVEIEGKQPAPRELARIINRAKELDIKVIFVQKQFSRESAEVVAGEIDGRVVAVDPLARNYVENMKKIAHAFAEAMQ